MVTTRAGLRDIGFEGFVRFAELPATAVPSTQGVYAMLRCTREPPGFLPRNPAGAIRGDPSVSPEVLATAGMNGAEVVYFDKAAQLQRRLDVYRRQGLGSRARHWGGRFIWQLADASELLVAWLTTPDAAPERVGSYFIRRFTEATGQRPFTNRNLGRLPLVRRSSAGRGPYHLSGFDLVLDGYDEDLDTEGIAHTRRYPQGGELRLAWHHHGVEVTGLRGILHPTQQLTIESVDVKTNFRRPALCLAVHGFAPAPSNHIAEGNLALDRPAVRLQVRAESVDHPPLISTHTPTIPAQTGPGPGSDAVAGGVDRRGAGCRRQPRDRGQLWSGVGPDAWCRG